MILLCVVLLGSCLSTPSDVPDRSVIVEEKDVTLTLFEEFEMEPLSVQVSRFSDKGGAGITSMSASTSLTADNQNRSLAFMTKTKMSFANPCEAGPEDWFNYYLTIDTQRSPKGFDGIAVDLKARHCNYVELVIKEERAEALFLARAPVFLNENEWQQIRIPFSQFAPDEEDDEIDMRRPLVVEFTIPYEQNLYLGHFLQPDEQPELLLDNLAYFVTKEPAAPKTTPDAAAEGTTLAYIIEDFENSVSDLSFFGELAEAVFYVDYSTSDKGECRMTPGIESYVLRMNKITEEGNTFLRIHGDLLLTQEFASYLDKDRSLYLFLRTQLQGSPAEWQTFRFTTRSDNIREGQVDFIDSYTGAYYAASFRPSSTWTEVRLPKDRLQGDDGNLADAGPGRKPFTIIFSGKILPETLRRSLESGMFSFYLDIDTIGYN